MERSEHTNRNSNVVSTVWTSDGEQHTFRHRNTTVGWVRGCERVGVDPRDVVNSQVGMPDSDRVR
jgi:hypothetical protein